MGVTRYITMTTREYALLARLEGQVRGLLRCPDWQSGNPARDALSQTVKVLGEHRKGQT